jgi:MFS family permease
VSGAWQAIAAAAVVGFGASVAWPAQDALLAAVVDPAQRSSVFAVRHATLNLGLAVGGLLAAAVVDVARPGTFEAIYLLDAVSSLVVVPVLYAVPVLGVRPRGAPAVGAAPKGYRAVLRDPVFRRVWLLMALLVLVGYGSFNGALPALATGPGGLPASAVGLVFAANTATVVVAQLLVLRVAGGRSRSGAVAVLACAWGVTWLAVLGATLSGGDTAALALFCVAAVVFALGETLLSPTMPAIANDLAPDALRGRYNGAFVLAWTTGFFAGPFVSGLLLGAGRDEVLLGGLVAGCAAAAAGALRLGRHLPGHANRIEALA